MRLMAVLSAALLAASCAGTPGAVRTFAPSGPWKIAVNEDSCLLRRNFSAGEEVLTLELQRYFPGDYRAIIERTALVPTNAIKIRYRVNDDATWHEDIAKYNWRFEEDSKVVFFPWAFLVPQVHSGMSSPEIATFFETADLRSHEVAGAAKIETLTVEGAYENPMTLRLGSMAAPVDDLHDCFDTLLTSWGIDPAGEKTLTRRAKPTEATREKVFDPIGYLVSSAKPTDMTVRLIVGAEGEIESCHFDKIKQPPAAIESFCGEYRRLIDFEPALDADGKGVRSHYIVRYINPNE